MAQCFCFRTLHVNSHVNFSNRTESKWMNAIMPFTRKCQQTKMYYYNWSWSCFCHSDSTCAREPLNWQANDCHFGASNPSKHSKRFSFFWLEYELLCEFFISSLIQLHRFDKKKYSFELKNKTVEFKIASNSVRTKFSTFIIKLRNLSSFLWLSRWCFPDSWWTSCSFVIIAFRSIK